MELFTTSNYNSPAGAGQLDLPVPKTGLRNPINGYRASPTRLVRACLRSRPCTLAAFARLHGSMSAQAVQGMLVIESRAVGNAVALLGPLCSPRRRHGLPAPSPPPLSVSA